MSGFRKIICGALKHARLQARRERITRNGLRRGGRNVLDELPPEIPQEYAPWIDDVEEDCRPALLRLILRLQIRDFTMDERWIELLERRLLKGESIKDVAQELGLNYASARRKVSRASEFLGLK